MQKEVYIHEVFSFIQYIPVFICGYYKEREPVLVKHVIEKILKKLNPKDKERLKKLWEETAGPELSRHTRLTSLRKGRLTIEVENSSWLYEMTVRHKPRLIKELQGSLGEKKLKELRFRLGKID